MASAVSALWRSASRVAVTVAGWVAVNLTGWSLDFSDEDHSGYIALL